MPGQPSFRRLLLSRILMLSIPILLLGVGITFRKARTSLLDTARQNLIESATRKADTIEAAIGTLQSNLAIAGQTNALKAEPLPASLTFLNRLAPKLPDVQCLQLTEPQTHAVIASTCGTEPIVAATRFSSPQYAIESPNSFGVYDLSSSPLRRARQVDLQSQLDVVLSVPVYDPGGQLRYVLSAQSILRQMESAEPWSLLGYTVVIDQQGNFLAHPFRDRIGRNIHQEGDASRLEDILDNTFRGERNVRHLFNFAGDDTEWLAGFSPITLSTGNTDPQVWTVLAVTRLDNALQGLESITQVLVILTAGLLAAHLLAMLYIARDIALPIEKLGKYARLVHKRNATGPLPKEFRVRELNQLAEVLDLMVNRLEERAHELETAWQAAETANQLKSEFLATTSHELRTPLNAIIGCIKLVQDGYCDSREEEMDLLQQADKAAIHLLKIINDLLDIRGIEEGKLRLYMEVVDLRQTLKEVVDLQTVEIHRKKLQLVVPDLTEPILVSADAARLKQVLLNVVSNAVKFTDHGSITITTQIQPGSEPPFSAAVQNGNQPEAAHPASTQTWIVVSVKDTGIGIEPDQQHKLFRPFAMADGSTTRKFEGTGLGLAISRNLVDQMGGKIMLHSDGIDQGTCVEIAMPILSEPRQNPQESPEPASDAERIASTAKNK